MTAGFLAQLPVWPFATGIKTVPALNLWLSPSAEIVVCSVAPHSSLQNHRIIQNYIEKLPVSILSFCPEVLILPQSSSLWPASDPRSARGRGSADTCWPIHINKRSTEYTPLYCITPWCQSVLWPSMERLRVCVSVCEKSVSLGRVLSHYCLHTGTHSFIDPSILSKCRCSHSNRSFVSGGAANPQPHFRPI